MNSKTESTIRTALLARCKKGDNKAYKELYHLYAKAMLNISIRIVNNLEKAEDVLQESFLKVFQNIEKFEQEAAFAGWLKRVVINSSIDLVRKEKHNFISLDNTDYIEPNEEEEEEIVYDVGQVKKCIQLLPDGYRVVLTLYLFEDYSHREIASTLNITEGTSKSQYNRAKKKLIELLKETKHGH
ncbi:MAG TPA: RNA polymerase sigma factor [Bacteroidia bacterium]|jgi:RNA polymerase sigma-70 factor (ECF subfamily)